MSDIDVCSGVRHLQEMESYAKIPPAVNQIEVSVCRGYMSCKEGC